MAIRCFAAKSKKEALVPYEYEPQPLGPWDIEVKITHCGICHSDISLIDNEWGISRYPLVPGHEIVGTVVSLGSNVQELKVGQRVGIGWQRSSCMHCEWCIQGEENLCLLQEATCVGHQGGFAESIRADSRFAFAIPDELDSAHVAPLFCGGATVYSPLVHHGITPMSRIGIIGVGGLGHLALQFAKGFGCEITAFSSSREKEEESKQLGAHHFISSVDKDSLQKAANSFDFLLCTVPTPLNWEEYLNCLRPKGTLCFVGAQTKPIEVPFFSIINGRKQVCASNIASRPDMNTLLRFAVLHGVQAQVELFPMREVNQAIEKVRSGAIRYRAVLYNES
ncbi:MAG: NAD(P)-dependent alcohol dehydrogenase [Verrucomicrobia bacterium]|nr:NAD(P)-dependent alcohol dehydrogenase [Verrucomicrobiota bacterium]